MVRCRDLDPSEYPMYPRCNVSAYNAAIVNPQTAKEADEALITYAKETLEANAAILSAQVKLAKTLKELIEKNKVNWGDQEQ